MIIVNADDFGLTEGVTKGIVEAHKKGIVTHTSIMSNGLFFEEASEIAKEEKDLGVGIHLVMTWGKPVLERNSSLIDNQTGEFFGYRKLILNYLTGRVSKADVYAEWECQIIKSINAGIKLTHIDSHHHIHMLPMFYKVALELGDKYKIKRIRVTREKIYWSDSIALKIKKAIFFILSIISRIKNKRVFYGLSLQKAANYKEFLLVILCNNNKDAEVMVHPGIVDEYLIKTDVMTYARERELAALTDHDIVSLER